MTQIRSVAFFLLFPIFLTTYTPLVSASDLRDFLVTSVYGATAGTIVGGATLAFAEKPGEKLQRIPRGTSLGLYAGMVLGLYIIHYVPDKPSHRGQTVFYPAQFLVFPRWEEKHKTVSLTVRANF